MPTFFDGIKRNFKDVPLIDGDKISTSEFLEAAESLVTLFDLLGSTAFAPVQNDMNGNIKVSIFLFLNWAYDFNAISFFFVREY